jgi:hypothetical protein
MSTLKLVWNTISRHIVFIIALVFLIPLCYLIYTKYFKSDIKEGMGEGRLRDIIHKIAIDKNVNASDKNKLIAIQNLLLVSSAKVPTDDDIKAKKAVLEISELPKNVQEEKIKLLSEKVDKIYPYLSEAYPEFDLNFWKKILTSTIKKNTNPKSRSKNPNTPNASSTPNKPTQSSSTIKYTFNEKLFMVLNNDKLEDSEKIKIITKLTKPKIKIARARARARTRARARAKSTAKSNTNPINNTNNPTSADNPSNKPEIAKPRRRRK